MTPNQQAQKDKARMEAEKHLSHSAVDRMREAHMAEGIARDNVSNSGDRMRAKLVKDANGASAAEDKESFR